MQLDHLWGLRGPLEIGSHGVALPAQLRDHLVGFFLGDRPADHPIDRSLEFALSAGQLACEIGGLPSRCFEGPLALRVIDIDEIRDRLARTELGAKAIDDTLLNLVEIVVSAVLARLGLAPFRAHDARAPARACGRHAAAARAATQQTGKQPFRTPALAGTQVCSLRLPLLRGSE